MFAFLDAASGFDCRFDSPGAPAEAYGRDPAFLPMSSIYDGNLDPSDYYTDSERNLDQTGRLGKPPGFFPYGYNASIAVADAIHKARLDIATWRLYFDERIQGAQVKEYCGWSLEVAIQTREFDVLACCTE